MAKEIILIEANMLTLNAKQSFRCLCLGLFCVLLVHVPPASAQEKQKEKEWKGQLADGTVIIKVDLRNILDKHKMWIDTEGKEGQRANLKQADLKQADLRRADLRRAILRDANLQGADLRMAEFGRTYLEGANLTEADLRGTNLKNAKLRAVNQEAKLLNADLSNANLEGVDLTLVKLSNAKLKGANLRRVRLYLSDVSRADLSEADLTKAHLSEANLTEADLRGANLTKADLSKADLTKADLRGANLESAYLVSANLRGANLAGTQLKNANLYETNIDSVIGLDLKWQLVWELVNSRSSERSFTGADLSGAYLRKANLTKADLSSANLTEADLSEADLTKADLSSANLTEADLRGANLTKADLRGANLSKADLNFADLAGSYFEPANIRELGFLGAKGLSTIRFDNFSAVADLRKMAREAGLRSEDRALTSALRKHSLWAAPPYERILEYILLDLPTDSGANPWRSIVTVFLLIPVFSIPYIIVLGRPGKDGIWKVWIPDRLRKDLGEKEPIRLILRGPAASRLALYFSLLSAFSIGWRELNIGNWIARIQRREYTLRASGWAKTLSGIQSLISVYLVALWVLTYFGRPFE